VFFQQQDLCYIKGAALRFKGKRIAPKFLKHPVFDYKTTERRLCMRAVERIIFTIEMVIAALLGIGIVIGLWDLVKYFTDILYAHQAASYDLFQAFLGHALVLIVGVELILMILYHSTKAILELVLIVIARKMLIYSNTMIDLVFGTLAIATIFVILKYLVEDKEETIIRRAGVKLPAAADVREICAQTGLEIPTDKGSTVGSLVCSLADEACRPVKKNAEFVAGDIHIKVTKATKDGVIEEVVITDGKEKQKDRHLKMRKVTGIH
jgi:hypothetical protein